MTERSIVEAAARLRQQREPYLVATVVSARGSAYRPPGTRMVLTRFRWIAGAITGGCLEGDFASDAWWRTRDGDVVLATYDGEPAGAGDLDLRAALGLGDGAVEVLLERIGAPGRIDALAFAERCLRSRRRGAIATVYRSTDPGVRIGARVAIADGGELEHEVDAPAPLVRGAITEALREAIASGTPSHRSYASARGALDVLVEPVLPPPCLFVFGTGLDALPVAQLARS
ncbi:MAG: XdhC family protein, partial [Kofleriaceae bacterium]